MAKDKNARVSWANNRQVAPASATTGSAGTRPSVSGPFLCCWHHLANTIALSDNL